MPWPEGEGSAPASTPSSQAALRANGASAPDGPAHDPHHDPTPAAGELRGDFAIRDILGVKVSVARASDVLMHLVARLTRRLKTPLAFANANLLTLLTKHERGPALLSDFLVINDGVGLDIASKQLYGVKFPDNLNGTDFTPALLRSLPEGTRVFLYGSKPDVLEACAAIMPERYGVTICGVHHGYTQDFDAVADAINQARADVVLVALGNPRQEIWIADYGHRVHAPLLVAVGAFLDFTAGKFPRAPRWMRTLRIEFLFRLAQEPRRLLKRYTLDIAEFLWKVRGQKARTKG